MFMVIYKKSCKIINNKINNKKLDKILEKNEHLQKELYL